MAISSIRKFVLSSFTLLSCSLIISCSSEEKAPPLEGISDIIVSDNGNQGNGSDLEINFDEQLDQSLISSYRVFVVKAENANSFTTESAESLSSDRFEIGMPDDIFPIQGVRFKSSSKDVDGDLIKEGVVYKAAVLTVSNDASIASNILNVDGKEFQLFQNNIVSNFTKKIEGGAGSLTISRTGNLYMVSYNIIDHLILNEEHIFPIYEINNSGSFSEVSQNNPLMMGNAIDSKGVLYQSLLIDEEILRIDGQTTSRLGSGNKLLSNPDGLFVDQEDNVYVVTQDVDHVLRVDKDGNIDIIARIPPKPRGITGDELGNIYISHNSREGTITKVSSTGDVSMIGQVPTFKPESYTFDYLMWVGYITYHEGDLYVAGMSTDLIYKVSLDGNVEPYVGSGKRGIPRGDARTANLNRPIGLVFSNDGKRLYISVSADTEPRHTQSTTPAQVLVLDIVE